MKKLAFIILGLLLVFISCHTEENIEVVTQGKDKFFFTLNENDSTYRIYSGKGDIVYGKVINVDEIPFSDNAIFHADFIKFEPNASHKVSIHFKGGKIFTFGLDESNDIRLSSSGYAFDSESYIFDIENGVKASARQKSPSCECICKEDEADCDVGGPGASSCGVSETKGGGATIMGTGGNGTYGKGCSVGCLSDSYACCNY